MYPPLISRRCHDSENLKREKGNSDNLKTGNPDHDNDIFLLKTKPRNLETANFPNRENFKPLIYISDNS